MSSPDLHYHTNNRIVAVDIVRLMAAMAVMYTHAAMYGDPVSSYISRIFVGIFCPSSTIFFVLAGYFACRNITWKKAFNNAWWCFAPFILWNGIAILRLYLQGRLAVDVSCLSLIGCTSFIIPEISIFEGGLGCKPVDVPLWFMRDLIFLFILSPILFKAARFLFPALLLLSLAPVCSAWFTHDSVVAVMSPYSLTYFTAGCFLRIFSKDTQRKALSFYNTWLIVIFCIINGTISALRNDGPTHLLHCMVGLWVFYQIARWCEENISFARPLALKFAPVTFLTFASHWFIFPHFPGEGTPWILLYPIVMFSMCAVFFFALKRFAKPLLHLVAHYKLRPDDLAASTPPKVTEAPANIH